MKCNRRKFVDALYDWHEKKKRKKVCYDECVKYRAACWRRERTDFKACVFNEEGIDLSLPSD